MLFNRIFAIFQSELHKFARKSTFFSISLLKNVQLFQARWSNFFLKTKHPSDFLPNAISFHISFPTPKYPSGRKFPSKWKR
jgi:hypothetical protein